MSGRRRRRWPWALVAGVLVLGLAGAAWWLRPWEALAPGAAEAAAPVTARVESATLTSEVRLSAQLGYGEALPLPPAGGVITALPAAGSVVATGQAVYEVAGRPVVLLPGSRPFWRELSVESDDGEDIRQLQAALAALGHYEGEADGVFGWRTRQAVRAWQESLGVPDTGVLSPTDVVVVGAGSIRIARVTARLGESGASPATYTETTLRATARLTEAQARELDAGTPVTVVLPDGAEIEAALSAIDPGGQPTGKDDATTKPSATIEFADQAAVAAAGPVAVRVVIRLGGYAVEVLADGEIVRTPVEIGLVADARVQVLASGSELPGGTGPVLAEGDLVVLAR